ncbi:MAG: TPM domain-containing protein [Bacteroidales bacterium]|nr:TPM domain-containing protein [Bacteroidales bacterium]
MKRLSLYLQAALTAFLFQAFFQLSAQEIPDKPFPPRLVNDFTGFLSREEAETLERKLVAFSDTTSTQIAVVIVKDLAGYDKADYAQRLGEKWGVGQKGSNNGIIVLVKPKTDFSRGEVFIAPGYGLEGVIPDLVCAEIVDREILPAFRQGEYFRGLDRATDVLMALASGEFPASGYMKGKNLPPAMTIPAGAIIIIVIVLIIFLKSWGSNNQNISGRKSNLPLWLILAMMNSGGRSHRGSWGGFSGGGLGGGRSGGFGGFGGGSFGGGGAGGSW